MNRTALRTLAGSASVALVAATMLFASPAMASAGRDRDHDGMPNAWEVQHHLNARVPNAQGDPDHDGLANLAEYRLGTDPRAADSDDDGTEDAFEDSDGDGVENEDEDLCLTSTAVSGYDDDCDDEGDQGDDD